MIHTEKRADLTHASPLEAVKTDETVKRQKLVALTLNYMKNTDTISVATKLRTDRQVEINGKLCHDFSSCSYIGMESYKPAVDAFDKTCRESGMSPQTADFFAVTELRLELLTLLEKICGGKAVITPSTSIASACFCDTVLRCQDIVYSETGTLHMSFLKYGALARERGTKFVIGELSDETRIKNLASDIKKDNGILWIAADSWDSAYGKHIKWEKLVNIARETENVGLFVDDAHGFGTHGKNGRGWFLEVYDLNSCRVVVAISLNKGLVGYGGALVLSDHVDKYTGVNYVELLNMALPNKFQGSLPPPIMAMNIAILKYACTSEFAERQKKLRENCCYVHKRFQELILPNTADEDVPLKFLQLGYIERMVCFVHEMRQRGFSTFPMFYPAVSLGRSGVRITISSEHTIETLELMCKAAFKVCSKLGVVGPVTRVRDPFYDDDHSPVTGQEQTGHL